MSVVHQQRRVWHGILAAVAVVFGLATIVAGGRVLFGADPGYVVFRPLLVFNTAMGVAYVAAGLGIWRGRPWRASAAGAIVVLNLIALGAILLIYSRGGAVAVDSLRAMTFRSVVWLALFTGLVWRRGIRRTR